MVIEVETQDEFDDLITSAGSKLVVVDFWAQWCGPCKIIGPEFVRLSKEAEYKNKVVFIKVDVEELPDLAEEVGIEFMPTFVFFKDGEVIDQMAGANKQVLKDYIDKNK